MFEYEEDDELKAMRREHIMEVVDNQLRSGDPPETLETYERLLASGIDVDETRRLISLVILDEIFCVVKNNENFNEKRFVKKLEGLPETPWLDD